MKCSESWLREWVNPDLTREELCETLTMAGLEVEDLAPVADNFSGVVVGHVLKVEKHPEADRLNLCEVDVGASTLLKIVCGAANVKVGFKAAVATIGAVMPGNITIKPTKIRGIDSEGMMCSASELKIAEESQGLLELAHDAPIGEDVRKYLALDDYTIDISITPNRGDCLSIRGIAREVAALTKSPLHEVPVNDVKASGKDSFVVTLEAKSGCPHYVGRIIRNVKSDMVTPVWLKERLRRSGIRSINPIVDVTNYVMLELGQPMHAFDLAKIESGIVIRQSKKGEKIALLDGSEKELDADTLVIADQKNALAIAGVMGGIDSGVTALTKNIFLESAYFSPSVIARQRQYYGLNSDSAYRFERGVDATIQRQAIERATQLILDIAGGEPGSVIEEISKDHLPVDRAISLAPEKIKKILGLSISGEEVEAIFKALDFVFTREQANWLVQVPPYRSDISLPEDLIEEIARLYGYDKIPTSKITAELQSNQVVDSARDLHVLRQALCDQGLHEIVSYSFVSKKMQALLDPSESPRELLNPITADMAVMRTNLWPGLINTLIYNRSRQQHRVRLFEIGTCFVTRGDSILQENRVAGLIAGEAFPEQWGVAAREVDFYDLKGHVENILGFYYPLHELSFKTDGHAALHPGQVASLYHENNKIGVIGALHPAILQALDLSTKAYVFELDLDLLQTKGFPQLKDISKFPEIRRDIAILVKQTIPSKDIQDRIRSVAGDWLKDVFIFDVYQGKGISPGLKSIALGLLWQHPSRTLVDDEIAMLMERVITELTGQLGAELRS